MIVVFVIGIFLKLAAMTHRDGRWLKYLCQQVCIIVSFLFTAGGAAFSQEIKIGLLIQDSSYTSAVHGAELAVRNANEKGGMNGRPFKLVVRSMEGPWGTGSKQAVDLIFTEKVWALLGSHDGRNAHLVEQAATKSTVVFLSAWSGDPTLSQAFVPWFFNCAPNYNQHAEALFGEIYEKRKYSRVAVISDKDYDSESSVNALLRFIRQRGNPLPEHFLLDKFADVTGEVAGQVSGRGFDCIILFCNPGNSLKVLRAIRRNNPGIPLFGSLIILNEDILSADELKEVENSIFIPVFFEQVINEKEFSGEYFKTYGTRPGMVASYSFDMTNVLINAILHAGSPDREQIQEALKKTSIRGITGLIRFDDKGNRKGKLLFSKFAQK